MKDERRPPKPSFGDLVENGWASENNPTRRGFFVREYVRTGKLNAGRTWEITDRRGKFWTIEPWTVSEDGRLTVTPAAQALRSQPSVEEVARVIERELDVSEMVLTDPLTLRRIKAERIARQIKALYEEGKG